ncbi:uncharacterized protein LTR77_005395 [Saxophila tyrrhenica]|uniref:BTB domain-containing protein n=1 Tax=Saxophila tyrrhenica TaxID=1690608 RepID=A0AAV9PBT7_9PEZI|nr:hypothetical protein LTR77_005395 [Saxophila tyrrhenica]
MPPNNTPAPSGQSSAPRRRPTAERVVPAIPLALTRPRPAKTQPRPKPEVNAKIEDEHVTGKTEEAVAADVPPASAVSTGGGNHSSTEAVAGAEAPLAVNAVKDAAAARPGSEGSAAMSLSPGDTPDPPTLASTRSLTPPPAAEEAASHITTPPSAQKNEDKFDMRHIRTELPPAFIPSAEQHTPRSAASSHSNRPQFLSHAHPTHPSVGSIVFGAQDSPTSSPAPPLSGGSAFIPPPLPGPQQPYFVPNGHAHHVSEPYGQRMFQQQQPPWNQRHPYGQQVSHAPHHHPHAHTPFRYPPREVFTPTEPRMPNGSASRSDSQASAGALDGADTAPSVQSPTHVNGSQESRAPLSRHAQPRPMSYSHPRPQQPPPPPFPAPGFNADLENADALRSHILAEASNTEFADCHLQITDTARGLTSSFSGHKMILSRSPMLLELIRSAKAAEPNVKDVEVTLQGRYNHIATFLDALKYLYGGPLQQLGHHRPGSSAHKMDAALQHISIGAWLKVPALANRGVEFASSLLHWDSMLPALGFTLQGGLSHVWIVDDGSEDRASTSSSDDSLSRSETLGAPTYDPHATHLLQHFYLDASAPHLDCCSRLPSVPPRQESQQPKPDPRLSQIRFGEVPVEEEHQRPSPTTTTISSILLSLPFVLLKWVLEHFNLAARLGPDTVASIMRQVVAEREVRRVKAEKARVAGQLDTAIDPLAVQNLLWQESVEPSAQHRAGFRLFRRKRDIDTPPSSGACSESNK